MGIILPGAAFGQTLSEAKAAFSERRYEIARQMLDFVIENDSLATSLEAFYWRARTNAAIAADIRGTFTGQDTSALFQAHRDYQSVKQMGPPPDSLQNYRDSVRLWLDTLQFTATNIAGNYYKQAYRFYQDQGGNLERDTRLLFRVALKSAQLARQLQPRDTLSHNIATYSAYLLQDYAVFYEEALALIKSMPNEALKRERYQNIIETFRDKINDLDKTLSMLDRAIEDFPNDRAFLDTRLDLRSKIGENEGKLLEDALDKVAAFPDDPLNHYNLAVIYQRLKQHEPAAQAYQICIRLDPSNYSAIYNLGGIFYNQGIEKLHQINRMTFTEYQKQGKTYEQEANVFFEKAEPYFEELQQMDADEEMILPILQQIYKRLNRTEKLQALLQAKP
ncbi:MAG: hypothetical protein HC913_21610 [Microscillaceae bacterium]|nr:hypothetical protein [Microscillaceae bacterium]